MIRYCVLSFLFSSQALLGLNITVEGMPGAGKTTTLIGIIDQLPKEFILLSETNPEPGADWQNEKAENQTQIYHQMWIDRMSTVERLSQMIDQIFLFDRSYFSNLAFLYALDSILGTKFYDIYIRDLYPQIKEYKFSLIIVLDVNPAIGYDRRSQLGEDILFPWCKQEFLAKFREFYLEELKNITSSDVIFINTDTLSQDDLKLEIFNILISKLGKEGKQRTDSDNLQDANMLLKFGEKYCLGEHHSKLVNVLGSPTIYFLRHSVQLVSGEAVFFNNERLSQIINEIQVVQSR